MTEIKSAALELGTERIRKLLVQYAVPAIIAMTASSLYNMVDSIFIGHGVGPLAISGLALTFPLMNLAAAFGSLVGVGAATLISMRLGQRDYETAQRVLGNVLVLNLIIGISFGLAALLFLDPILYFFGASEATIGYAREYMTVILLGNVVTHMYLGLNSVLRASGHPRKSMYATIITVVINAVLDPIFIFGFGWGVRGSAFATITGQCVALVLEDLQFAIDHLPYEYKNNSEKPEEDRVYGARFANRLCGRIAMALKARLLLQAASPAFNPDNDAAKWEAAAVAAAELIDASGGIDAIDKSRIKFWLDDTSREIVWRKDYYTGRDWETTCFPPSLLGNGRMNPTQDFADAFPYRNGVPYVPGNPSDPDDPYAGRDPRLDEYLIRNGSLFKDNVINTVDGDVDGIDRKPSSSTTTGYYMKKLMNPSVNHTTG